MKPFLISIIVLWALMAGIITAAPAVANDMRAVNIEAEQKKAALLEKAQREESRARKEAEESRQRIVADKTRLVEAVQRLKNDNRQLESGNNAVAAEIQELHQREQAVSAEIEKMDAALNELLGLIRVNAKDMDAIVSQSPQSAVSSGRSEKLRAIIDQSAFPGMEKLEQMADMLFEEIRSSGEVRTYDGDIVDRSGRETVARILQLGHFTAAYQLPEETGFLLYSDTSQRFFALSKLPDFRDKHLLKQYMAGNAESVPIDISKGGALRQLTHRTNLWERIRSGGPLVWPILAIGVLALLIILERFFYLNRNNINADGLMHAIRRAVADNEWKACRTLCSPKHPKPIARVLAAGIEFRSAGREDMENVLQEAVLREIPKLERFLSTLGMLAAIAPLLGLLGTVTGMIATFDIISWFGTGNARAMAGGISEALITTQTGLFVAIPGLYMLNFLNRRATALKHRISSLGIYLKRYL